MRGLVHWFHNGPWPQRALVFFTVTLTAVWLGSAFAKFFVSPTLPRPVHMRAPAADAARGAPAPWESFSPIWKRNAFKAAIPNPKASPKDIEQLPVAQSKFKLLGTMFSDVPALSRAVILQGGKQELVAIGDKLDGFTVIDIQRRGIVLQAGGKQQVLFIDAVDKKIAGKDGQQRQMIPRSELRQGASNQTALGKDIETVAVMEGDRPGLRIEALRAGSLFSKAGFQKGDIFMAVEGIPVSQGATLSQVFELYEHDMILVDLVRNGKPLMLILLPTGD